MTKEIVYKIMIPDYIVVNHHLIKDINLANQGKKRIDLETITKSLVNVKKNHCNDCSYFYSFIESISDNGICDILFSFYIANEKNLREICSSVFIKSKSLFFIICILYRKILDKLTVKSFNKENEETLYLKDGD